MEHEPFTKQEVQFWWGALVAGGSAYFLFGGVWRSVALAFIILICLYSNYARRWLIKGTVILLALSILVLFEIIDPPTKWREDLQGLIGQVRIFAMQSGSKN